LPRAGHGRGNAPQTSLGVSRRPDKAAGLRLDACRGNRATLGDTWQCLAGIAGQTAGVAGIFGAGQCLAGIFGAGQCLAGIAGAVQGLAGIAGQAGAW